MADQADHPWQWDETLYAGSARYYPVGRMPYPAELIDALAAELHLDGTGRLLDVGCGPGSLTVLLAPLFAAAVGVDPDPDMLAVARQTARAAGLDTLGWHRMRAEELPAGLGRFRVVTFAQSFHWMDQPRVAERVRSMLEPGGRWVHVSAVTHRGLEDDVTLPLPGPPWPQIESLVAGYLGDVRRAGRGTLPGGTPGGEDEVMRQAGYTGPVVLPAIGGAVHRRSVDQVLAAVFSLSYAAPHLFGGRLAAFEGDLRGLLADHASGGWFAERVAPITARIWRAN